MHSDVTGEVELNDKPQSRPVHLTLKDWSIIVGFAVLVIGFLSWFIRVSVNPVEVTIKHHAEIDDARDAKQDRAIESLDAADTELGKALHRIELKQERLAPRHRVDSLPAHLRTPPKTDDP